MKLNNFKKTIKSLGNASKENSDALLAQIHDRRKAFAKHLDAALTKGNAISSRADRQVLKDHLRSAAEQAKALGHYAYDLFPARRLKQFAARVDEMTAQEIAELSSHIGEKLALQTALLDEKIEPYRVPASAFQLRALDNMLSQRLASPAEAAAIRVNNAATAVLANAAYAAIQPVGWTAEQIARPLMASRHWITGGKVSRGLGHIIHGFLSRDSLARTGLETSWGVRFIVPGTVGFIGNAGPWVMFYTGQIRDYQAMAVPFRINPGATLATDVATLTMNRPGFGAGTATPIASGYVDSARSKLLIGKDGVLYIRVGEWEGRGAYFTVSAFIPLLPWMHITWNFSVFSPGWQPVVRWSRPAIIWVRGQADWLWKTLTRRWRKRDYQQE